MLAPFISLILIPEPLDPWENRSKDARYQYAYQSSYRVVNISVNELRRAQQFEQAENYREPSFLDSISEGLGGFKDDVIQGNPAIRELLKMLRWTD